MADFTRRAKPGNAWRHHEFLTYNISIVEQDPHTFFGSPLPDYTGPAGFIQHEHRTNDLDDASLSLMRYLELATQIFIDEESAVTDFVIELLRATSYKRRGTIVRTRKLLQLEMCLEDVSTYPDICLMDIDCNILLLVQENKSHINPAADPQAQLVAEAIAAFQRNNEDRVNNFFLPALESRIIPGITMIGTYPRFYKIHVTSALDCSIRAGSYPAIQTSVYRHTPHLPRHSFPGDEMKPLANRILILQYFEAFKKFVCEG